MADLKDLFQGADWKTEKHAPVIEAPDLIIKGEAISVTVSVGKEIPHPNTADHHIKSMELYFLPLGEKFPYQIARFEFNSHGESIQGPNTSTVYSEPKVVAYFRSDKPGDILVSSYCNIHGIWKSAKEVKVR